jgi:predicted transcriptional regulator
LPHLSALYNQIKGQGFTIVAMNRGDTAKVVTDYWRKEKFPFPAVLAADSVHEQFGVRAYPTNYVVNGSGRILARFVGYDEGKLKSALRSAGLKVP